MIIIKKIFTHDIITDGTFREKVMKIYKKKLLKMTQRNL